MSVSLVEIIRQRSREEVNKMGTKLRTRKIVAVTGTMVLSVPIIAACSQGPTFDQWAETDGAAGRINLDEVQEAFKKSESATEFERRVNEIYEGDGLILIRVSDTGSVKTLEGFEDLNNSSTIEDGDDDLLFSITQGPQESELRGHGSNGYYRSGFGGGDFLFTYLIISSLSRGPYFYQTPRTSVGTIRSNRGRYRSSSTYRSQVSKNTKFFDTQKKGTGRFSKSAYDNASRNKSASRTTYQNRQKTSGGFKRSTTGVRSSWGSRSTGSSFGRASTSSRGGGFRGFGGAQRIIGIERG